MIFANDLPETMRSVMSQKDMEKWDDGVRTLQKEYERKVAMQDEAKQSRKLGRMHAAGITPTMTRTSMGKLEFEEPEDRGGVHSNEDYRRLTANVDFVSRVTGRDGETPINSKPLGTKDRNSKQLLHMDTSMTNASTISRIDFPAPELGSLAPFGSPQQAKRLTIGFNIPEDVDGMNRKMMEEVQNMAKRRSESAPNTARTSLKSHRKSDISRPSTTNISHTSKPTSHHVDDPFTYCFSFKI